MSLILLLLLLMMMVMILMLIMMVNGDTYVHDQSKIWCVPVPSCSLETLMSFQEIEGQHFLVKLVWMKTVRLKYK